MSTVLHFKDLSAMELRGKIKAWTALIGTMPKVYAYGEFVPYRIEDRICIPEKSPVLVSGIGTCNLTLAHCGKFVVIDGQKGRRNFVMTDTSDPTDPVPNRPQTKEN